MQEAQQPMHHNKEKETREFEEWAAVVSKGVSQIINGPRANVIPTKSQLDLAACLNLLEGSLPLPFDWDISIYTNPQELKAPRLPTAKVGTLPGDKSYKRADSDDDYDDEDLDAVARPQWQMGEVRIVKMQVAPYWSMARYMAFFWKATSFV